MRIRAGILLGLLLIGCVPAKPPVVERHTPSVPVAPAAVTEAAPTAVKPDTPANAPRMVVRDVDGITFEGVSFDIRNFRMLVVDQPGGPGSRFTDAQAAGVSRHAIAAVNAGFFTPEGTPLGLVVCGGKSVGAWNSASSLGSGVWYQSNVGDSHITRRETLGRSSALTMRELIQAGPMLVENGRMVGGLDAAKTSARTAILCDGNSRWWIGHASPCSLADFAKAIATAEPAGWKAASALNLDGGRSADLWISDTVTGGPLTRRTPWNRPVRNFLVLVPR